jgi:hypothetical protein
MHIPFSEAVNLLHAVPSGALATLARDPAGYPFATVLPFVPDAAHRPLFLISALAEHTKNLLADPRASLLVADPAAAGDVQSGARMTLVGDVLPVEAEAALIARYLRYQPEAEQYLALGDFRLFRLQPKRVRLIAGFGRMGWLEGEDWLAGAELPAELEQQALAKLQDSLPDDAALLGLDCYGLDLCRAGLRVRLPFAQPVAPDEVAAAARSLLPSSSY